MSILIEQAANVILTSKCRSAIVLQIQMLKYSNKQIPVPSRQKTNSKKMLIVQHTQQTFTCSKSTIEAIEKGVNMFKANN